MSLVDLERGQGFQCGQLAGQEDGVFGQDLTDPSGVAQASFASETQFLPYKMWETVPCLPPL